MVKELIYRIKNSPIIKKLSLIFFTKIYSIIISLVSSVLIVRYLGPQLNGVYNYAIAYSALFSGIAALGLDNILVKEFSKKDAQDREIFVSSIIVRLVGAVGAFILLLLSLVIFGIDKSQYINIFVASFPFFVNVFSAISSWHYANGRIKEVAVVQSIGHSICLIMRIFCIYNKYDILSLLVVQLFETVFLIFVLWILYFKHNKRDGVNKSQISNKIMYLFRQGLPICLGSIAYSVFMKMDQVMIREMIGEYELGIYSCAVQIAELWYFIPNTIMLVLLPELTKLHEDGKVDEFNAFLQKSMSGFVLLGYLASLFTMVFSRLLIKIMYGAEYYAASPILCIYIWAGVFVNMSVLRGNYFVIKEWTECSLVVNLMGAVSNIILNYFLIKYIGQIGAALSTLISFAIYAYISSGKPCIKNNINAVLRRSITSDRITW